MALAGRRPIVADNTGILDGEQRRVYDPRLGMYTVRLQPGECYTTAAPDETLVTILGSCVAACIRNPYNGYGGMNHFMLPESQSGEWSGVSAVLRYGNHAMETLINAVLKSGCSRDELEIKLFGGSDLANNHTRVGSQNASFAVSYLSAEGLNVISSDLGGPHPRVIQYTPSTGGARRVFRKLADEKLIAENERKYKAKITSAPEPEGDIELFD